MNRKFSIYAITILMVSLFLSACGGGGGGTGGGAPRPTVTGANSTLTYGYYMSGTSIMFYDPAHPSTAPTAADTGLPAGMTPMTINIGTYDAANKRITDMRALDLLYSKNGMIYSLSVLKSGATPTPAQLSAINTITYGPGDGSSGAASTDVCGEPLVMPDLATPAKTTIAFKMAGPDKTCNTADDDIYAATLDTPATTAAYNVGANISHNLQWATGINSVSTGALTGFLVFDASTGSIIQTDATWHNAQTAASNVSDVKGGWVLPNGNVMFGAVLTGDTANVRVVQYNPGLAPSPTNPNLSSPQLMIPAADSIDIAMDGTDFYVADYTARKVYRVPLNPTATDTTTTVLDESSNTSIVSWSQGSLRLTSKRVLIVYTYTTGVNDSVTLGSVLKTGQSLTSATYLADVPASNVPAGKNGIDLFPLEKVNLPGSAVFFNRSTNSLGSQACSVNDDGTELSCSGNLTNDVEWVGFNTGSSSGFGYDDASVLYEASTSGVNTTLTTYDAADGNALATLGTLANIVAGSIQRMSNNYNDMLILTVEAQTDVYNTNSVTPDSLVRVTNDAASEVMIAPAGQ